MESRKSQLEKLIYNLERKNISKVYEIFKLIDQTDDLEIKKENNIYLYLLSFLTELPEEYIERIRNIKDEDILITKKDIRYKDISLQNKIRISILRNKFHEAIDIIEKNDVNQFSSKKERDLFLTLITLVNEKETEIRKKIECLAKNKAYEQLVLILEKRNKIRKLNLYEAYIYVITISILRIIKNNKIPKITNQNPNDLKSAIIGYNFQMALIFNKKDLGIKYEESKYVINLLLVEINKLIDNVIKTAKNKIEEEKRKSKATIKNIKEELLKGNIEISLNIIKEYLKEKKQEEYLYLIEKLIKISIVINDNDYKLVIDLLNSLNDSNYKFDIKYFYSECHNAINRNDFVIAELYLDIIKYYQPQYKEEFTDKELNKITTTLETNKKEQEFLLSELSQLEKNNEYIKIIKKIPHTRRNQLIKISNDIKELSAFSIGIKEPKDLVLRRINPDLKNIKENSIMSEALNRYLNKEYDMALLLYMRLLTSMNFISTKVLEMIGLCYYHLNETEEALKYLKFSKQFNKHFQANRNGIEKLIDLLESEQTEEKKSSINDFVTRYDKEVVSFDIDKLEQIFNYMKENYMTIEEGIEKFELVPQQILIIKLLYAKYYYQEGMILSGEKLLEEVENSKPKTRPVVTLLNEIRSNKKLYQNKNNAYSRKKTK